MHKCLLVDDANNSSIFEMRTKEQSVLTKRGMPPGTWKLDKEGEAKETASFIAIGGG